MLPQNHTKKTVMSIILIVVLGTIITPTIIGDEIKNSLYTINNIKIITTDLATTVAVTTSNNSCGNYTQRI